MLPIPASRPDPRLPESWRQPAPFSGRARLPRGPGSGWGGGRGLDDPGPQRPGLSRPLRQIAADRRAVSLESPPARRLPPDPITPRRVGPSGWEGVGGRGESRRPDLFSARPVAPALLQKRQRGHFFRLGPGKCLGRLPVWPSPSLTGEREDEAPPGRSGSGLTRPLKGVALHPRARCASPQPRVRPLRPLDDVPRSFGDPITLGAPDY